MLLRNRQREDAYSAVLAAARVMPAVGYSRIPIVRRPTYQLREEILGAPGGEAPAEDGREDDPAEDGEEEGDAGEDSEPEVQEVALLLAHVHTHANIYIHTARWYGGQHGQSAKLERWRW